MAGNAAQRRDLRVQRAQQRDQGRDLRFGVRLGHGLMA